MSLSSEDLRELNEKTDEYRREYIESLRNYSEYGANYVFSPEENRSIDEDVEAYRERVKRDMISKMEKEISEEIDDPFGEEAESESEAESVDTDFEDDGDGSMKKGGKTKKRSGKKTKKRSGKKTTKKKRSGKKTKKRMNRKGKRVGKKTKRRFGRKKV